MIARKVNKLQDGRFEWTFGHSMGDYTKEEAQIEQDILTALYEWKYDCFFALEDGIDWASRLGYPNQKNRLDEEIIFTIQSRNGVLGVTNFESIVQDRHYSFTCNVFTEYSNNMININFTVGA